MNQPGLPLLYRIGDLSVVGFFLVNLLFITYIVDLEQLVIADPTHFQYPLWPPSALIDLVHWYGSSFDPVLMARPMWWKMTIWIDVLFFGPFYVVAIYAFLSRKNWIRIPAIIYSSVMMTNVTIILGEEVAGAHATPHLPLVLALNAPWLLFPLYILLRMWSHERPFIVLEPSLAPLGLLSEAEGAIE
ncbi:MAG: DUF2781 domain-containing protein [Thermaceae bacterium]|nr:DUF2781 domain-containing protein [Thermaceae bacterium]